MPVENSRVRFDGVPGGNLKIDAAPARLGPAGSVIAKLLDPRRVRSRKCHGYPKSRRPNPGAQIPTRRSLRCVSVLVDFGIPLKGDCPPAVLISKYLAGGFHALERLCRSRRVVLDGLGYLVYSHDLTR